MERIVCSLSSGMHTSTSTESGTKLSWPARMRQNAAARLSTEYKSDLFITGGNVYKGYLSLAEQGKERVARAFGSKNTKTLSGHNTLEEIYLISQVAKERGLSPENVTIVSNEFHHVAKKLSEEHGFSFVAAEDILEQNGEKYKKLIHDLRSSKTYKRLNETQMKMSKFLRNKIGRAIYKLADFIVKRRLKITAFDPFALQKL